MTEASDARRALGAAGERLAALYLQRRGYRIIARNVRLPSGEIDLVAWQRTTLVLVEVRVKRSDIVGEALQSIVPRKQERLRRLAQEYCAALEQEPEQLRIDVVGISLDRSGRLREITLVQNAVEEY